VCRDCISEALGLVGFPVPPKHDAVPEAKATNDGGTPKDADGTGNTQEPVQFIVYSKDGRVRGHAEHRRTAEEWAEQADGYIVPLYRAPKPTLTDDERDAIYDGLYCLNIFCNARQSGDALAVKLRGAAETLRSLLERLAGYTA
jgi:hypothetical protein